MRKSVRAPLAGVAIAALAAAGVAMVVHYRQGRAPDGDDRARLDELAARLDEADAPGAEATPGGVPRVLENLRRSRGISTGQLRRWIAGVRQGTLTSEQATVAESDFEALEREADQAGL